MIPLPQSLKYDYIVAHSKIKVCGENPTKQILILYAKNAVN